MTTLTRYAIGHPGTWDMPTDWPDVVRVGCDDRGWLACDHPERVPDEHTAWHTCHAVTVSSWPDPLVVERVSATRCEPCWIALQAAAAIGQTIPPRWVGMVGGTDW